MKKIILFLGAAVLCAGVAFGGLLSEDPGELTVAGQYWYPDAGNFTLCDAGYGATVTYREWFRFPWGVGVNLGLAKWQVDKGSNAYKYDQLTDYKGDLLLIPFGASLYFNAIDWDNWNLNLETGIQYVFVDSSASVFNNEPGVERYQDVDVGDAVIWNIGAEYEYMLTENLYVVAGIGYQVDVMASDTEYNGKSTRKTSFEGTYGRLGAKFLF